MPSMMDDVNKNKRTNTTPDQSNDYATWVKIGKALVADQLKFEAMTRESKIG